MLGRPHEIRGREVRVYFKCRHHCWEPFTHGVHKILGSSDPSKASAALSLQCCVTLPALGPLSADADVA